MLNQDINDFDVTTPVTAVATVEPATTAVAVAAPATGLSTLDGAFKRLGVSDNGTLPADATVGCTVINGNIKFGEDMKYDFGDFVAIKPINITRYLKLNLGIPNPNVDEKRMCVNCYDNETVSFGDETMSKEEMVALVKSKGYSKCKWEERAVLHGTYLNSDKHDRIKDNLEADDILAIYLSPSSLRAWGGFMAKAMLTGATGDLKLTKVEKSVGTTNWTQFGFALAKPADYVQG